MLTTKSVIGYWDLRFSSNEDTHREIDLFHLMLSDINLSGILRLCWQGLTKKKKYTEVRFWKTIFFPISRENFSHVEVESELACCYTLTENKLTYSAALFIWTISTVIKLITLEVHGDTFFIAASKLIFFTWSCFICKLTYKVIKND